MSLISARREDLPVGTPLPWPLFDENGEVLLDRGRVIAGDAELESLLAAKPMRELSWAVPSQGETGTSKESSKELDAALADGNEGSFTFTDMHLRVGERIQVQPPANVSCERYVVKLIGYVDKVSVLVTAPYENGLRVPLRENDTLVARIFSAQKAFGFSTSVERVCKIPYDYLHLAFPEHVQGSVVRKSPRVRTRIIVSISTPEAATADDRSSGLIVNLSADGALVKARQPLAANGGTLGLAFRVNLHNVDAYLTINAVVRSAFGDDGKGEDGTPMFSHGVQFRDLAPNDSVILQSLIYQQMIEQPHTLA